MAYAFANCGIYSKYRLGGLGAIAENAFGMPGSFLTNYIYAFSVVIANVAIATTLSAICWVFSAFSRFGRCAVLNDSAALALDAGDFAAVRPWAPQRGDHLGHLDPAPFSNLCGAVQL
mgnify:CR=1 FL=1